MSREQQSTMLLNDLLDGLTDTAGLSAVELTGVSLDSRQIKPGYLYLAVGGSVSHGLRFADAAIAAGAVVIAIEPQDRLSYEDTVHAIEAQGVLVVSIPSLPSRCAEIASRFYHNPDRQLSLVAVTGTDGKTSVCRFIAETLTLLGQPCGYIGTLGWGIVNEDQTVVMYPTALTTPDSVALRRMLAELHGQGAVAVALEASSHGLAEGRLDGLSIDVAVLTNLGRDHLDYHKTIENYQAAKARLFGWENLQAMVVNTNDEFGRTLLCRKRQNVRAITYAVSVDDNDKGGTDASAGANAIVCRASHTRPTAEGLQFTLSDADFSKSITSPLMGMFNIDNLLACHAVLRALGHAANEASATLETIQPVAGRMERFSAHCEADAPIAIVDYAHTPQALDAAIAAVRPHCSGELWVVFGCGGDRDTGKRAPMGRAAEAADHIVVTDDNPRTESSELIIAAILDGMRQPSHATVISDRSSAIRHAMSAATARDIVLVAGKGHEDYQVVGTEKHSYSDRALVDQLLQEAC